jgi:hypothetical protein
LLLVVLIGWWRGWSVAALIAIWSSAAHRAGVGGVTVRGGAIDLVVYRRRADLALPATLSALRSARAKPLAEPCNDAHSFSRADGSRADLSGSSFF